MSSSPPAAMSPADEAKRREKLERLRGKRRHKGRDSEEGKGVSPKGDKAGGEPSSGAPRESPEGLDAFPSFDAAAPPAEAAAPTMARTAELPDATFADAKALEDRWGTAVYLLRNPKLADQEALERTFRAARDGVSYVERVRPAASVEHATAVPSPRPPPPSADSKARSS